MDRLAVARILRKIGRLLEVQGASPVKARAYERGARALEALAGDLERVIAEDRLTQIPAIGKAPGCLKGTLIHDRRSDK
jgi:DNA polymerase (family 10)